jgi:hypothetical protein
VVLYAVCESSEFRNRCEGLGWDVSSHSLFPPKAIGEGCCKADLKKLLKFPFPLAIWEVLDFLGSLGGTKDACLCLGLVSTTLKDELFQVLIFGCMQFLQGLKIEDLVN